MDYSYFLDNYIVDYKKLIAFGFKQSGDSFLYSQIVKDQDLTIKIELSKHKLIIDVLDNSFNEKYAPFYVKNNGTHVKTIIEELLKQIANKCFKQTNAKNDCIDFIAKTYNVEPQYPWKDQNCTFVNPNNNKWFGLIMTIKAKSLGIDGDHMVDVINVKLDPSQIQSLIDNKQYFGAYHMNKKYWLTILLNKNTNTAKLHELIDQSYDAVKKV